MFEVIVFIAIILAIVIALALILAAGKPDTFRLTRTAVVKAAPETIFPLIADFHEWSKWSPWENRDPALKRTFSGAERGTGAVRMRAFDGPEEFLLSLRSAEILRRPKSLLYLQSLKWAAQAKERVT